MFGEEFLASFRQLIEIKYRLLPYIISQSKKCTTKGYPLLKPLFFEFGKDQNTWQIEDQYMFGENMLIAPFFEDIIKGRIVYLPKGDWLDYFTNIHYKGNQWIYIESENFGVALIKSGSCIPNVALSQSTNLINWNQIILKIYSKRETQIESQIYNPVTRKTFSLKLNKIKENDWELESNDTPIQFEIQSIT